MHGENRCGEGVRVGLWRCRRGSCGLTDDSLVGCAVWHRLAVGVRAVGFAACVRARFEAPRRVSSARRPSVCAVPAGRGECRSGRRARSRRCRAGSHLCRRRRISEACRRCVSGLELDDPVVLVEGR